MTLAQTVAFSRNSANVFFHILTQCNLKCRHCYINPQQHGQNTLPLSGIVGWLEAFSENSHTKNLIFLGGEPTLHPELPAAIGLARKMGFGSITVDTNGYLFHDILEKVTPGEVDTFSFSLDGATRQTNDRIRGKDSFETCVAGIGRAVSKGFNTSLIYTVSGANINELQDMVPDGRGRVRLDYVLPARGLIGFQSEFRTVTSGSGLLYHVFDHYGPIRPGKLVPRKNGVLISNANGKALAYSLFNLQGRGRLFLSPGEPVYEGMLAGIHTRGNDLVVNPTKAKQLTNIRAASKDENLLLTPRVRFSLEEALEFIADDELLEVTPAAVRLRKKLLIESDRRRAARSA